jgi:hypothetical protein
MGKKIIIATLALTVVLGGCFALYYFSDTEVIKRQLSGLAAEIGKEGQEPPMAMALKMRTAKNALAKSCLVVIPERGYSESLESDLIIQYLIYHRNRFALLAVAFENMTVAIPAKERAAVQTAVRLRHLKAGQTELAEEVYQVELALVKRDKKWLLDKVTLPEALVESGR